MTTVKAKLVGERTGLRVLLKVRQPTPPAAEQAEEDLLLRAYFASPAISETRAEATSPYSQSCGERLHEAADEENGDGGPILTGYKAWLAKRAPSDGQPLASSLTQISSTCQPSPSMQAGTSTVRNLPRAHVNCPPAVRVSPSSVPQTFEDRRAPIEYDHQAINYVIKIKKTFEDKPGTCCAFLKILHAHLAEQKSAKDVYEEVRRLFKDHTELFAEFSHFLPDGSPEASRSKGAVLRLKHAFLDSRLEKVQMVPATSSSAPPNSPPASMPPRNSGWEQYLDDLQTPPSSTIDQAAAAAEKLEAEKVWAELWELADMTSAKIWEAEKMVAARAEAARIATAAAKAMAAETRVREASADAMMATLLAEEAEEKANGSTARGAEPKRSKTKKTKSSAKGEHFGSDAVLLATTADLEREGASSAAEGRLAEATRGAALPASELSILPLPALASLHSSAGRAQSTERASQGTERAVALLRAAIAGGGLFALEAALAAVPREVRESGVGAEARARRIKLLEDHEAAENKAKQEAAEEAARLAAEQARALAASQEENLAAKAAAAERKRSDAARVAAAQRARVELVKRAQEEVVAREEAHAAAAAAERARSEVARLAAVERGGREEREQAAAALASTMPVAVAVGPAIPDEYVCPITSEIMADPVVTVRCSTTQPFRTCMGPC